LRSELGGLISRRCPHYARAPLALWSGVRKSFVLAGFILLLFVAALVGRDAREQARIDFLLHEVETSVGIKFIRNGMEHDGPAAAKHLRSKLGVASARIATAEEFVKYCASESSLTHQKYKVKLADGTVLDAAAYLEAALRKFDQAPR
jgi:Family of unknown function (DUF5329)